MNEVLRELYRRDLLKLKKEIERYSDDSILWIIENSIKNSGGNLCLHLIGNLKAFIGVGLAGSDYVRQRDFEFAGKDVPREELYAQIDETIKIIDEGLSSLTDEQFSNGLFPIKIWKEKTGMAFTLMHLHAHLNYHLGQINYHRRLLDT